MNDQDPIDLLTAQLELARYQAQKHDFASAYQTLAVAYENLIEQHEQAIEEVMELRKKVLSK